MGIRVLQNTVTTSQLTEARDIVRALIPAA
jgi:hypothetical protein